MQSGFSHKVEHTIRRYHLLKPGARVGVAVSGGPDSVALLSVLRELKPRWDLTLLAAHVHHGLRYGADQDQELVEGLCRLWEIPLVVRRLSPPGREGGVEAWAREERYCFFAELRETKAVDFMALGHTRDDQAETVLFRLLRGSGPSGLRGIPPIRDGWIVRPLLACSRDEVLAYLKEKNLPFALDPTNEDLTYSRNRIRRLLLPWLEKEFSPSLRQHLLHLADLLREEDTLLTQMARASLERVRGSEGGLSLSRLRAEPKALRRRLLKMWLVQQGGAAGKIGFDHILRVEELVEWGPTTGKLDLPGGIRVVREYDFLKVEKPPKEQALPYSHRLFPGQELFLPEAGWRVELSLPFPLLDPKGVVLGKWQAVFDGEHLEEGVTVRSFRAGDRILLWGGGGRKKVQDVFVDGKVPVALRRSWPLVVAEGEVVWVPGLVRSPWGEVSPKTRKVCTMKVRALPKWEKL